MKGREHRSGSNTYRVRRAAVNVIMVCLALIVVFAGYRIWDIQHNYKSNQAAYDAISEAAEKAGEDAEWPEIDFEVLRGINPDVLAWIRYEGSLIDYPVVQGDDNDKYLHTMFDGVQSGFGALFVDAVTAEPFDGFNTIIYGHHMLNGSMFGDLRNLKDTQYCREHPEFQLITPEGRYRLRICAFLNQPGDSQIYTTNFTDPAEMQEYIDIIRSNAEYVTSEEMTPDDRLVILSTCAYEYQNARYMVVTKMIPADH